MMQATEAQPTQPAQQPRQAKPHAKAKTKTNTVQPAPTPQAQHPVAFGFGFILGLALFMGGVAAFVYVCWRILKALMGYRTVTVVHERDAADDRIDDLWR
jgi:hypothetical protein